MTQKKISLTRVIFIISLIFLGGCGIISDGVMTKPEYIKEVIVRKEKFNDIIDNFLDQVETYDDTQANKDKLISISTDAKNFVSNIKEELGAKVPSDCKEHYNDMISAYSLYLDGINIYVDSLPKPLGNERNNGIKNAEDKFHQAQNAMMNLG